jgi:hypothetical protein
MTEAIELPKAEAMEFDDARHDEAIDEPSAGCFCSLCIMSST